MDKRSQRFTFTKLASAHIVNATVSPKQFKELPIQDGVGEYHANQMRVYFRSSKLSAKPVDQVSVLATMFTSLFPLYFNDAGPATAKNLAQVEWGKHRRYNDKETLRFEVEIALHIKELSIDLPNLHSDWVYIVWSDPRKGFAAQTLARDFSEKGDWILRAALALLLPPIVVEDMIKVNKYHFLAGRRSWTFGYMHGPKGDGPVYYLDTAAIERYSLAPFKLAELDPGFIVNMRATILKIWVNLLANFIVHTGFDAVEIEDSGVASPSWTPDGIVRFRECQFVTEAECVEDEWIRKDVIPRHPALGDQLQTYSPRYYVQVGAFNIASNAERLASRIQEHDARVYEHWEGGVLYHKVRIGPFASEDDAKAAQARISSTHPDLDNAYVTFE